MPFPPSPSIDAVEKACPAIRALAQTGGLTEEAWALGILHTAIHTDNPSAAAHAWSRSYPGYQPDQVDHKLSEQHKASKPPTGCERIFTLEASCATACNSCTYRGKVSSPIHAAQKWTAYTQATFPQQVLPVAVTASPSHVEPDYGYTDTGNAQRLHRSLGDRIAWVHELHTWLCFSDGAWNDVSEAQMIALATPVMRQLYGEAAASPSAPEAKALATHATKSLNNSALNNTVALLKSRPGVEIHATQLNANDMQLGTADGHVIDLTTGTSRPQIPADFITKALGCQFDPAATCPTWLAFLASIFQEGQGATQDADDGGRIVYLQQWVGYALTGQTKEQQFQFAYGLGANGKTVLYRILQALLGSYCLQSQPEAFMLKQSGEGATPLLARLQGARLVIAAETEDGQRLAESTVKQLTGGDTIVARPLYGQPFEFNPKFKLVIVGNHKPLIRGDDHGIWRRVHLLPFNRIFEAHQQDRDLYAKLHRELPGILNWAIEGCLLWQKAGRLTVPNLMQKEVQEYRSEMDLIQQWLLDDCDVAPGLTVPGQSAYACFSGWCKQNGNGSFSNRRFSQKLIERGFKKTRTKSARGWDGFTCRQSMFASLL
jgi:putative DNA primase/helicase